MKPFRATIGVALLLLWPPAQTVALALLTLIFVGAVAAVGLALIMACLRA